MLVVLAGTFIIDIFLFIEENFKKIKCIIKEFMFSTKVSTKKTSLSKAREKLGQPLLFK